jgi:hypothetical protein
MRSLLRGSLLSRWAWGLFGWRAEVLDEVPVSIGVGGSDPEWYLTTLHGDTFENHEHVEIRLDRARLLELQAEVNRAVQHMEEPGGTGEAVQRVDPRL